jgi:hypothetical protein
MNKTEEQLFELEIEELEAMLKGINEVKNMPGYDTADFPEEIESYRRLIESVIKRKLIDTILDTLP